MTLPPSVIFPVIPQIQVTLNCNLACTYCFQQRFPAMIKPATVATILHKAVEHNRRLGCLAPGQKMPVYWHGGEPLLAGLDFFKQVMAIEAGFTDVTFENRIQTNATLMTEEFARFFAEHNFAVGFSLDGPEDIHNRHRRRATGGGSFDATMRGIELYRHHAKPGRLPIIAVITRDSIGRAPDLYNFFKAMEGMVQLDIYDLRSFDLPLTEKGEPGWELAPSSKEVGNFLIELFDLWFYDPSRRVDFKELRQEVKMILQPEQQGGDPFHKRRCDIRRTIFDPQGRVFSCDQYVNDDRTMLGRIQHDSLTAMMKKKLLLWEEIKRTIRHRTKDMACNACEWGRQCIGGCLSCMKYNALLLRARAEGQVADGQWPEIELPDSLAAIAGETYYCDGLRRFRDHVKKAVQHELSSEPKSA